MKRTLMIALALLGTATAQTRIGSVTITRPAVQPAPVQTTQTAQGAHTRVTQTQTVQTRTAAVAPAVATAAAVPSSLPAGWRLLSGRITSGKDVRLPAGSKVQVTIEEVDRQSQTRKVHLKISFGATKLSAPYQIQYNPARLNSSQNIYLVRAKVMDKQGRVLYSTSGQHVLPKDRSAKMNIRVQ